MAVTYFGHCNSDGTLKTGETPASLGTGWTGVTARNAPAAYAFTCPGTGTQDVISLGHYVKYSTGTADHIRMAIYDTAGTTLIGQGSAEITVDNAAVAWREHTAFTNGAGDAITPQLAGGTAYMILVTYDGGVTEPWGWTDWGALYGNRISADYTAGFPASLGAGVANDYLQTMRCGVEPPAAGGSPAPKLPLFGVGGLAAWIPLWPAVWRWRRMLGKGTS